ncbi:MAG: hypothetical protein VX519_06280 [Myxococcota bacterium]|nr:hypothetical protein [Myxococcota bacterium]
MKDRLLSLLTHRRLPWILALLGVVLCSPSLWMGIYIDDYLHQLKLQAHPLFNALGHPSMELFRFFPGGEGNQALFEAGIMPWWSHPDIRIAFWRPLSSATHLLDHTLWPDNFLPAHLHSLAWYAVAILVVTTLYRKLIPTSAAAGLAAWMFAIEDSHAMATAWLANRNALLPLIFGAFALMAHIRWQQEHKHRFLAVAILAFILALSGGEAALGALAYIVAWQLTLADRRGTARLTPLIPYALIVLVWRILYNHLGYGAYGSGPYIDPANEPIAFLAGLAQRGPLLLASLFTQAPIDPWIFIPPSAQWVLVFLGCGVVAILVRLFLPLLENSALARFFGLGMLLSMVPVCASFPMDRLCIQMGIGAFGLIALLAQHRGFLHAEPASTEEPSAFHRRGIKGLLLVHAVMAALLLPGRVMSAGSFFEVAEQPSKSITKSPELAEQTLIWINSMDLLLGYMVAERAYKKETVPKRVGLLCSMFAENHVTRVDEDTLEIRPVGGFLASYTDRMSRSDKLGFTQGQRIPTPDFEVEVTEVLENGRPKAARFHFNKPLEDPSYHWVATGPQGAEPFQPPAMGETTVLPPISPLFAMRQ